MLLKVDFDRTGIDEISADGEKGIVTVIGDVDPAKVACQIRKTGKIVDIISVGPPKKPEPKKEEKKCPEIYDDEGVGDGGSGDGGWELGHGGSGHGCRRRAARRRRSAPRRAGEEEEEQAASRRSRRCDGEEEEEQAASRRCDGDGRWVAMATRSLSLFVLKLWGGGGDGRWVAMFVAVRSEIVGERRRREVGGDGESLFVLKFWGEGGRVLY
ncbi:hypothetical protein RHGRI_021707 [Rhododendron griersonianum]|uniref:HMA domain-containing protein n=1 Tax=Rhododendron griersonianum TaxID=479676 RepID=A0AAV6JRA8_9ERIC|nr:hypothetical protein RHGRI_021707 [Rhododendron griersonianum]